MNIHTQPALMNGWLSDIGSGFMDVSRSIGGGVMSTTRTLISVAKSARGDTPDVVVQGGQSQTNLLIYGGLAALAAYVLVKK